MKRSFIRPLGAFPQTPAPVQGLVATSVSSTEIDLTWTAIAGAENYTVRQNGNPIFTGLVTSFHNTGLAPSTAYQYTVAAINSFGEGLKSPPVIATTPVAPTVPAAVTSLTATPVSTTEIDLSWPAASGATNYIVSRNGTSIASPVGTTFADTGLTQATLYNYSVAGHNSVGNGPAASASATTQAAAGGPSLRNNVGHYACFDYAGGVNSSRFTSGDQGIINSVATGQSDNLMGFSFIISWRAIDTGTTAANFNWTVVDQYANACRAKQKHWWCWLSPFFLFPGGGASCTTGAKTVPDWVYNQSVFNAQGNMKTGGGVAGGGTYPKYYNTAVQTAILQFFQAFVTRYESDPLCEGLIFSIGSSIVVLNAVDTLGIKQPQINYDTDYSDTKMKNAYITFMQQWRSMTSVLNLHMSLDYMFYQGDSNPQNWIDMLNAVQQYKCIGGGPDCLSKNWVYPNATPAITGSTPQSTFCLTPQPDARFAVAQTPTARNNSCFSRGVSSDQYYVGWKGFPAYKGRIKWGKTQELTEMGGYIGQFAASDAWETSGPKLYNVSYQHWDVNYGPAGNYGMNTAPNTLWLASTAYDATYGPSVYRWIQSAGPITAPNPYP